VRSLLNFHQCSPLHAIRSAEVVFADVGEDWNLDLSGYFERFDPDDDTIFFLTDLMGRTLKRGNARGMPVIEDACEAFGSRKDGVFAGRFGLMGTYSFFPSHTISTGEGGAIVTDDIEMYSLCRSIRAHGSISNHPLSKFTFPNFGFNARMTTMQAVIGISVMLHVKEYVSKRREIFHLMQKTLGGFPEGVGEEIVPHGFPIGFASETARDFAMATFLFAGVECRKLFSCIPSREEQYKQAERFPNAEYISRTHLYLPCHQNMTAEDVEYISEIMSTIKERI